MILSLTSGMSSFNNCKKIPNKCWLVPSFPKMGANNNTSEAKAARTNCDSSLTSPATQGKIAEITCWVSNKAETPEIFPAAAVLT